MLHGPDNTLSQQAERHCRTRCHYRNRIGRQQHAGVSAATGAHLRQYSGGRRGNAIVLVASLLVLLVIIATAYITRTQAGRVTARATQTAQLRDDSVDQIADAIAHEIGQALFPQPLDPQDIIDLGDPAGYTPRANTARQRSLRNPMRYGIDQDQLDNADWAAGTIDFTPDGIPDFPFNRAPYETVPFTNWPDADTRDWSGNETMNNRLPSGPGNVGATQIDGEGNPLGNPGMGDNRWLRDLEPVRVTDVNGNWVFSHWRHLSNLSRPGNAFRIARDIADVDDSDTVLRGGALEDLLIPAEQWLSHVPPSYNPALGHSVAPNAVALENQMANWFGYVSDVASDINRYLDSYNNFSGGINSNNAIPGNFYKLNDLDPNNPPNSIGERPEDEFIAGTPRHLISRFLTDTDGDGFTDAYWHTAPGGVVDGVRQIIAVSVIDNSAMLNANVATRFERASDSNTRTVGATPADIALVGASTSAAPDARLDIGFLDNEQHQWGGFSVYDKTKFADHKAQVGLPTQGSWSSTLLQAERLRYWVRAGLNPLTADTIDTDNSAITKAYRPYTLADELELRMFFGQNYPWIFSRLEGAMQNSQPDPIAEGAFMRAAVSREETNELLDQLFSDQLFADNRHRMTVYSASRNDLLPPWLRYRFWDGKFPEAPAGWMLLPQPVQRDLANSGPGQYEAIRRNFHEQSLQKVDLREHNLAAFPLGQMPLHERLPYVLFQALTEGGTDPNIAANYFDADPTSSTDDAARMSAAFAANILDYRDPDHDSLLADAVDIPRFSADLTFAPASDTSFLGMEPQPFLVEAFIAHAYSSERVGDLNYADSPTSYSNANDRVVFEDPGRRSSIVVVQIANPYDVSIDLSNYVLSIFGKRVELSGILPPATDELQRPPTAVFYKMLDAITDGAQFKDKWLDFLDIDAADAGTIVPANAIVWDMNLLIGGGSVDVASRRDYDRDTTSAAFELIRIDNSLAVSEDVVIDRFDAMEIDNEPRAFGDEVNRMEARLTDLDDEANGTQLAPGGGMGVWTPGEASARYVRLPSGTNHWVQWVRATRAWGVDVDGDGLYTDDERNPRYMFADRAVITAKDDNGASAIENPSRMVEVTEAGVGTDPSAFGVAYDFNAQPSGPTGDGDDAWFERAYQEVRDTNVGDGVIGINYRKPTFFYVDSFADPDLANIIGMTDKGWYGQQKVEAGALGGPDTPVDQATKRLIRHNFAMQPLMKQGDFTQVGELLNIWLFGHEVRLVSNDYVETVKTFSELMTQGLTDIETTGAPQNDLQRHTLRERKARVNRLAGGEVLGAVDRGSMSATNYLVNAGHRVPALPAGVRVLDAFVCDGPGFDGVGGQDDFRNAHGFTGAPVYGRININTAPPEVMRALPHATRLLWENPIAGATIAPRSLLPEGIHHYVNRNSGQVEADGFFNGYFNGPDYRDRDYDDVNDINGSFFGPWADSADELRGGRGMASIGEVMLVDKVGNQAGLGIGPQHDDGSSFHISGDVAAYSPFNNWQSWQVSFASKDTPVSSDALSRIYANNAYGTAFRGSVPLSTDVVSMDDDGAIGGTANIRDTYAGDVEEANLLFAGMSNLITTNSDTFTVYFRVRSFKQNPQTRIWDATDPEYIVDDSRYVMLVDRSSVNHPDDRPKILYLEKLAN